MTAKKYEFEKTTVQKVLAELTEFTLLMIQSILLDSNPNKSELKKQLQIAQNAINWMISHNRSMHCSLCEHVIFAKKGSVHDWAASKAPFCYYLDWTVKDNHAKSDDEMVEYLVHNLLNTAKSATLSKGPVEGREKRYHDSIIWMGQKAIHWIMGLGLEYTDESISEVITQNSGSVNQWIDQFKTVQSS